MPGILGLSLGSGADNLLAQHGLATLGDDALVVALNKTGVPLLFAVQLCDAGGYLWLGGFDRNHVAAARTPTYVPTMAYYDDAGRQITTEPYAVYVSGMALGNASVFGNITNVLAIVDTGNPGLALPAQGAAEFERLLGAALNATPGVSRPLPTQPNCVAGLPTERSALDKLLPNFTLTVSAGPNASAAALTAPASRSYMAPYPWNGTTVWCYELGEWPDSGFGSIGIPLMRGFVVVFDMAEHRIGFAPQAFDRCPAAAPAPAPPPAPTPTPAPGPAQPDPRPGLRWWAVLLIIMAALAALAGGYALVQARGWPRELAWRTAEREPFLDPHPDGARQSEL